MKELLYFLGSIPVILLFLYLAVRLVTSAYFRSKKQHYNELLHTLIEERRKRHDN